MEVIFHKNTPSSSSFPHIPTTWHYINDILHTESSYQKDELLIYVSTWNLHGKLPSEADLMHLIPLNKQFNLYLIATQECMRSIGKSFINSTKEPWHSMVKKHLGNDFHLIDYCDLSAMNILVFAQLSLVNNITNIRKGYIKTGFMNLMANKGAIAISFDYKNKSLLFIDSHLSSGQENCSERNQDFMRINQMLTLDLNEENMQNKMAFGEGGIRRSQVDKEEDDEGKEKPQDKEKDKEKDKEELKEIAEEPLNIEGNDTTISDMFDFVIWSGDMNYRINLPHDTLVKAMNEKDYSLLLENDQLTLEHINGRLKLNNFDEGIINFDPTYKYKEGSHDYDYNRTPGWTDRILYKSKNISEILLCKYASIQETTSSDHKPVYAVFKLEISRNAAHIINPKKTSRNSQMNHSKTIASQAGSATCVIY